MSSMSNFTAFVTSLTFSHVVISSLYSPAVLIRMRSSWPIRP